MPTLVGTSDAELLALDVTRQDCGEHPDHMKQTSCHKVIAPNSQNVHHGLVPENHQHGFQCVTTCPLKHEFRLVGPQSACPACPAHRLSQSPAVPNLHQLAGLGRMGKDNLVHPRMKEGNGMSNTAKKASSRDHQPPFPEVPQHTPRASTRTPAAQVYIASHRRAHHMLTARKQTALAKKVRIVVLVPAGLHAKTFQATGNFFNNVMST